MVNETESSSELGLAELYLRWVPVGVDMDLALII